MDISRNSCRLCLSESDFNVSLYGNYSRKSHIIDKILVCLKVVIEDTEPLTTICFRCAGNVERYYDFITVVKKGQNRLNFNKSNERHMSILEESFNHRHVTSYVKEQVVDADYSFSFLEIPEEKKEKSSRPFFSYLSPPNVPLKEEKRWKTAKQSCDEKELVHNDRLCNKKKMTQRHRNCSRDMFETQSQEAERKGLDWKLTPDDNILKRVREKIFGRSEN